MLKLRQSNERSTSINEKICNWKWKSLLRLKYFKCNWFQTLVIVKPSLIWIKIALNNGAIVCNGFVWPSLAIRWEIKIILLRNWMSLNEPIEIWLCCQIHWTPTSLHIHCGMIWVANLWCFIHFASHQLAMKSEEFDYIWKINSNRLKYEQWTYVTYSCNYYYYYTKQQSFDWGL